MLGAVLGKLRKRLASGSTKASPQEPGPAKSTCAAAGDKGRLEREERTSCEERPTENRPPPSSPFLCPAYYEGDFDAAGSASALPQSEVAGAEPFVSQPAQPSHIQYQHVHLEQRPCCLPGSDEAPVVQGHALPRFHAPHRTCSAPTVHLPRSSCGPMPSSMMDCTSVATSFESQTNTFSDCQAVEYGIPGWERVLTAQIAACTGLPALSSGRASFASGGNSSCTAAFAAAASALAAPDSQLQLQLLLAQQQQQPPQSQKTAPCSPSPLRPPLSPRATPTDSLSLQLPSPSLTPTNPLSIRVPSSGGMGAWPTFGQVVLPQALVAQAAEHGANLQMDLARDLTVDVSRPLGQGQFGAVFSGTYRGQPVAVKSLRPLLQGCTIDDLEVFVQEITVLSSLRHDNVVRLIGGCLQPPDICVVEELCVTSLDALLHAPAPQPAAAAAPAAAAGESAAPNAGALGPGEQDGKAPQQQQRKSPLPLHRILEIALDVALGLQHLHTRTPAIVHRDLKPSNILLDANGRAKISDFGLARCKYSAYLDTNRPETGSMAYMAPECWDPSGVGGLSDKMDLYSYGVVLHEMVTGERPWAGIRMAAFVSKVVATRARLKVPTDDGVCPLALRELISSCTEERPADRPSVDRIISELRRMIKYCRRD